MEDILNAGRIESLKTQHCPNCHVRIEKNGGCSHMHCSRCDHHFTWKTIQTSENLTANSLLNTFTGVESIKKDIDEIANIGLKEIIDKII